MKYMYFAEITLFKQYTIKANIKRPDKAANSHTNQGLTLAWSTIALGNTSVLTLNV